MIRIGETRWYAAHVIMYIRYKDVADQAEYPVYENVYLLAAENEDRAWEQAEKMGMLWAGAGNGSLLWNDHPAVQVFGGVRKIIECANTPENPATDNRPVHGSELTYSQFVVRGDKALRHLIEGGSVVLTYEE